MDAQRCSPNALTSCHSGSHRVRDILFVSHHAANQVCNKVDVDILKPDTGALQIERPTHSHTPTSRGSNSDRQESSGILTPEDSRQPYAEPVSEGEEDEEMDLAPGKTFYCNTLI